MAYDFEKRVKRMQRWVLGAIVALMVVPLVLWGILDPSAQDLEGGQPAGTMHGKTVTKLELSTMKSKAVPYIRYELLDMYGALMQYVIRQQLQLPVPRSEDVENKAWEMLVLLHDAKMKGVLVSQDEVRDEAERILRLAVGAVPQDPEDRRQRYFGLIRDIFLTDDVKTFEEMLHDALVIKKTLEYETGGSNIAFADAYQEIVREARRARVRVAGISPDRFKAEPRPVTPEAIRKYFDENKEKYEVPTKVRVEILMASIEVLKKAEAEPSEEELKKYYEENKKAQFVVTPEPTEGATPPPPPTTDPESYKPFEQVRAEIADKIKERRAREKGYEAIARVNQEIGQQVEQARAARVPLLEELKAIDEEKPPTETAAATEEERQKREADKRKRRAAVYEKLAAVTEKWFADLQAKYKREGIELTHDQTGSFDEGDLEKAWNTLGKPLDGTGSYRFSTFAFTQLPGDVGNLILKTDKGWAIPRVAERVEKYIPDLIEEVRQKIEKHLAAEDTKARTRDLATSIAEEVRAAAKAWKGATAPQVAEAKPPTPPGVPEEAPAPKAAEEPVKFGDPQDKIRELEARYGIEFRRSVYFGAQPSGEETDLKLGVAGVANAVRRETFQGEGAAIGRVFTVDGSQIGGDKADWVYVAFVEDVVSVSPEAMGAEFETQRMQLEGEAKNRARRKYIDTLMDVAQVPVKKAPAHPEGSP